MSALTNGGERGHKSTHPFSPIQNYTSHCDLMVSRSQAKIVENFANNF